MPPIPISLKIAERRLVRRNSNVRLNAVYGIMKRKYPQIDIFVNGQLAGYCMRGHGNIMYDEHRKMGLFREAMKHLEEVEREFFSQGNFERYRKHLVMELERYTPYSKRDTTEERNAIASQKKPVHFDFTVLADTARHLLTGGYAAHPITIKKLRKAGFRGKATHEAVSDFITKNQKEHYGQIVYLFFKPVKME